MATQHPLSAVRLSPPSLSPGESASGLAVLPRELVHETDAPYLTPVLQRRGCPRFRVMVTPSDSSRSCGVSEAAACDHRRCEHRGRLRPWWWCLSVGQARLTPCSAGRLQVSAARPRVRCIKEVAKMVNCWAVAVQLRIAPREPARPDGKRCGARHGETARLEPCERWVYLHNCYLNATATPFCAVAPPPHNEPPPSRHHRGMAAP